jgi:hypothetical protein
MRKSKKAAKGGKPEPEEAIMKEPTKHAEEQTIDPMDFLEAPAEKVDAPAQADEAFGVGDLESPQAIRTGLFTRKPISADVSNLRFEETHCGLTIPIVMGDTRPSVANLDAVAEEMAIADMTAGAVADSPEIKQEAVPQEPEPVKPIPPALPRRTGCEHGFPNVALCVTCRASGRR